MMWQWEVQYMNKVMNFQKVTHTSPYRQNMECENFRKNIHVWL